MRVTFITQTRLKHDRAFARRPDFQVLFRRLLHGDGPLVVDFLGLIDAAGKVRLVRDETRWTRCLAPFGQWTHVGSGTTFGLGRYRTQPDGAGGGRRA